MIEWSPPGIEVNEQERLSWIAKACAHLRTLSEPPNEDHPYISSHKSGDTMIQVERCYGSDKLWISDFQLRRRGTLPLRAESE